MSRRKLEKKITIADLPDLIPDKLRSPLGVILGSTTEIVDFLCTRPEGEDICYQMDLYQTQRLQEEMENLGQSVEVFLAPDLWDLEKPLQTVIYPVSHKGERHLKLDMVEQAFHVLKPYGILVVVSPYENDQLFPQILKKIFGKVHFPPEGHGVVFWAQRTGDRPKRRHEVTYQVSRSEGESLRFLSRPGVFSYGRFDNGARALVESMQIESGDKILDLGCGCGTNGIHAGLQAGPEGKVVFVDSNVRALALTQINAEANGLSNFRVVPSCTGEGINEKNFDIVLANPPYFAQKSIARMFIEQAGKVLKRQGSLYLVTKQPNELIDMVENHFPEVEIIFHRGYSVFHCRNAKKLQR